MSAFSERSLERLRTCHPDLQRLFLEVVKGFDCTVLEGHRGAEDQAAAYAAGRSQKKPGDSKHNATPSLAVDVAPFPIDWNDWKRWYAFGGYVMATAAALAIPVRWGGLWSHPWADLPHVTFVDAPHFELMSHDVPRGNTP